MTLCLRHGSRRLGCCVVAEFVMCHFHAGGLGGTIIHVLRVGEPFAVELLLCFAGVRLLGLVLCWWGLRYLDKLAIKIRRMLEGGG
jgi:hypothetical protein